MSHVQGDPFRDEKFSPSGDIVMGGLSLKSKLITLINGRISTLDIDLRTGRQPVNQKHCAKVGSLDPHFHRISIEVDCGQTAVTDSQPSRIVKTLNCGPLESRHRIVAGLSQPKDN